MIDGRHTGGDIKTGEKDENKKRGRIEKEEKACPQAGERFLGP
jgi:hypothetical protein